MPIVAISQNVSFTASGPSQVDIGSPFYVQYTLEAPKRGKNFQKPAFKNFSVVNISTSQGTSSSISIINGKISKTFSYTLTWNIMLQAKKTGTFTIPAATVSVSGKKYRSNTLTITVSKGASLANNRNNSNNSEFDEENSNITVENKDLYLSLTANKSQVYIGEPVFVACKMYSRYDVSIQDFKPAPYDNFWVKDLKMPSTVKAQKVIINNRSYLTATLDKKVIFPQTSGKLVISPYKASFQLYDGWGFPAGQKDVTSNKRIIYVKALPANKPPTFGGAVGKFQISATVDKKELYVDDALSVNLKITGNGNFGLFDIPEISMPATFEAMTPDNVDNLTNTPDGIRGSKTIKYSFIARVPGKYKIPQIEFSYFDPSIGRYKTIKTDTISIRVLGDSTSDISKINGVQKTQVTALGNDIRFIKTNNVKFRKKNDFLYGTTEFWILLLAPLFIFLFLIVFLRKKIKENADIKLVKYKKADKVSRKRLKTAANYLKTKENEKFFEEISKALWGYVSDKLGIPLADLTRDTVVETLTEKKVPEDLITKFVELIDICETARFAPSAINTTNEEIYEKAQNLIGNFEKQI